MLKLFNENYFIDINEIEKFVNLLKSAMDSKPHFELWSGKQIYDAYLTENYLKRNYGTLGSSCMNNKNYVGLYADNPEVCSILVLKDVDKILGRALVWKLNPVKFTRLWDQTVPENQLLLLSLLVAKTMK